MSQPSLLGKNARSEQAAAVPAVKFWIAAGPLLAFLLLLIVGEVIR